MIKLIQMIVGILVLPFLLFITLICTFLKACINVCVRVSHEVENELDKQEVGEIPPEVGQAIKDEVSKALAEEKE